MKSSAFKIAMLHISQNQGDALNKESPVTEGIPLDIKEKIIEDSLDSYYSPVITAFLRRYDDIGQLLIAAQSIVSELSSSDAPVQDLNAKLSNIKTRVLNAVEEIAMEEQYSFKKNFLNDPKTNKMDEEELDTYIRAQLGDIKRDTQRRVNKAEDILKS